MTAGPADPTAATPLPAGFRARARGCRRAITIPALAGARLRPLFGLCFLFGLCLPPGFARGAGAHSASVAAASAASATSASSPGAAPALPSCSAATGTLTLKARATRTAGISPLLVFFDATETTDTAVSTGLTAFQEVFVTWSFGDERPSGTGTWAAGSNRGHNSRNVATGAIAAHLYVSDGTDAHPEVTVTAARGRNVAACRLAVTVLDPSGAAGFTRKKTTCVAAAETPRPGAGGCPQGAGVLKSASFTLALGPDHLGDGRRVLFKCGDTFSGTETVLAGKGWSVGAYGACAGGRDGRPVIMVPTTGTAALVVDPGAVDGRISDLVFQGGGTGSSAVAEYGTVARIPRQITLFNLESSGNKTSYSYAQGAQMGLIDLVQHGEAGIGTYLNFAGNNPCGGDPGGCSGTPAHAFNDLDYQALLGSDLDGRGASPDDGPGIETVRIGACRLCVISNNTLRNANHTGPVLKLHNGNTYLSAPAWTGVHTELIEISDNWIGGSSASQTVETAPQNSDDDERLRDIVFERNLVATGPAGDGGKLLISARNETVRNNVFYTPVGITQTTYYAVQVAQRGVEPAPRGVQVLNNTCYGSRFCVGFDGVFFRAAAGGSVAAHNLYFNPAGGFPTVVDKGSGNAVSDNSPNLVVNPQFANGSKTFGLISDFRPGAAFAAGSAAATPFDALGAPRRSAADLGAVLH